MEEKSNEQREVLAELERVKQQRDGLLAALKDMVASQERRGGSPAIHVSLKNARAAIAACEKEGK